MDLIIDRAAHGAERVRDAAPLFKSAVIDELIESNPVVVEATFRWHFALHYVLFTPDAAPIIVCRGVCPMQVRGSDMGVLFEASYVVGGS